MVTDLKHLEAFDRCTVLVMGDLILDHYLFGRAQRISPEAPVPVLRVEREEWLPGGVGNVALNIRALGASVKLVGRIGCDSSGERLTSALKTQGLCTASLISERGLTTSTKTRSIADSQHLLRIDHENPIPMNLALEESLILSLPDLLKDVTAVALSDYAKGFFSTHLLRTIIEKSLEAGIPVIVDPKGLDFSRYHGATLIKPNLHEAYSAANLPNSASLDLVAETLLSNTNSESLLITQGKEGMALYEFSDSKQMTKHLLMTKEREVRDVTGAGDTVLAVMACAMGSGLSRLQSAQLANLAAGLAVEHMGCVAIKRSELTKHLIQLSCKRKLINSENLHSLKKCMGPDKIRSLTINPAETFDLSIFEKVKAIKLEDPEVSLVLQLDCPPPSEAYLELVATLEEVDYIHNPHGIKA